MHFQKVRVILDILLGGETALIISPSRKYIRRGESASFFVLAKRTQKFKQILCGYQVRAAQDCPFETRPQRLTCQLLTPAGA
jgi:hypothetical protein